MHSNRKTIYLVLVAALYLSGPAAAQPLGSGVGPPSLTPAVWRTTYDELLRALNYGKSAFKTELHFDRDPITPTEEECALNLLGRNRMQSLLEHFTARGFPATSIAMIGEARDWFQRRIEDTCRGPGSRRAVELLNRWGAEIGAKPDTMNSRDDALAGFDWSAMPAPAPEADPRLSQPSPAQVRWMEYVHALRAVEVGSTEVVLRVGNRWIHRQVREILQGDPSRGQAAAVLRLLADFGVAAKYWEVAVPTGSYL